MDFATQLFPLLCVFLRTTGVFVTAPVLSARFVPAAVKVGLSLVTSLLMLGSAGVATVPDGSLGMAGALLGELSFGLFMGFIATVLMAAIEVSGHITDLEIGFGLANVIDPEQGQSSPLMGMFKYMLVTVLFLVLDGHHLFLKGISASFAIIPAGSAGIMSSWASLGVEVAGKMLYVALVLSFPIWAAMLVTDIGLGIVARSVPQMNVFIVGMPLKSLVGFMVLSASVGFLGVFTQELTQLVGRILQAFLEVGT